MSIFSVLYYLILNFTTNVIAFVNNVINFCIKLTAYIHISDFILRKLKRTFGGKVKGQRGQISKMMASLYLT